MEESKPGMQKFIEHIEERVKQLEGESLLKAEELRQEAVIKMVAAMYDKSSAYIRIVVGVGYAGFFILWVNLKDFMGPFEMVSSGGAILISATIYILFEVYNMIKITEQNLKLKEVAETPVPGFQKKLDDFNKKNDMESIKIISAWRWTVNATLIFGLVGVAIMLYSFGRFLATG